MREHEQEKKTGRQSGPMRDESVYICICMYIYMYICIYVSG